MPLSSDAHYLGQQMVGVWTAKRLSRLWQSMGTEFGQSWAHIRPMVVQTLSAGQVAAASLAVGYVDEALRDTGQSKAVGGEQVDIAPFVGVAADGRGLGSLVDESVITAKTQVAGGADVTSALAVGGRQLVKLGLTTIQDTGRSFVGADIVAHRKVTGYVRMLNPPSCSRCVMLAGKWFKWNKGFQRHPRCDCRHIPASESVAGALTTDPYTYFNSLSEPQQNKLWGKNDAYAIRNGADIFRVGNVRARGLSSPKSRQARLWGTPTKMTIDDILAKSGGNRERAIKLMGDHGFILPGGQQADGVLKGNAYQGMTKRTLRLHQRADIYGFGHTAAEQRVQHAVAAQRAVNEGRNPFSSVQPLTDRERRWTRTELNTSVRRYLNAWR